MEGSKFSKLRAAVLPGGFDVGKRSALLHCPPQLGQQAQSRRLPAR